MDFDITSCEEICVFCKGPIIYKNCMTVLTAKGCEGIHRASNERDEDVKTVVGQKVHTKCKRRFCNSKYILLDAKKRKHDEMDSECGPSTRKSTGSSFNIREHCLFCGQNDSSMIEHRPQNSLVKVSTLTFKQAILEDCKKRNDSWSEKVQSRIEYVQDLFAADAVYHQQCRVNFSTKRQLPVKYKPDKCSTRTIRKAKLGRTRDTTKSEAFLKVAAYLESHDEEQTTIQNLIDKMSEYLPPEQTPYSFPYMKYCLQTHFGDKIVIAECSGKANIVTFKQKASSIINEFYNTPKDDDSEVEKMKIISAACKLIKSDIKSVYQNTDEYPKSSDMSNVDGNLDYTPTSLKLFLEQLFSGKDTRKKVGAIGHAMMQAARPRGLLPPLQVGLAIQLHHHFASRFLIDTLHEMGFCSSYSEVLQFEKNAAVARGIDIPGLTVDDMLQYMADNVDHDKCTIDGRNTYHGMGIIVTVTPAKRASTLVPRKTVTFEEIQAVGQVNITEFPYPIALDVVELTYKELPNIEYDTSTIDAMELLYDISPRFVDKHSSWSGTMQMVHNGPHAGPSSVLFLPMINLDPSNVDCIYSTLLFVTDHAARYDVTAILTFDQPLWWKALLLILSLPSSDPLRNIILRLGGFHTLMSFLGSIGSIMDGSGIQRLLQLVYAESTVNHMLSGKAYARAVRGHMLVSSTVNKMFVSYAMDLHQPANDATSSTDVDETMEEHVVDTGMDKQDSDNSSCARAAEDPVDMNVETGCETELGDVKLLFEEVIKGDIPWTEVSGSQSLQKVAQILESCRHDLQKNRTAKMWFQYLDMIRVLRAFIWSERTGIWRFQLKSLCDMLPYLAASGHHLYTKSLYIYLTRMLDLPQTHPVIYERVFEKGLHVVRRSSRLWAGLSTDLVIEQVLMRSLKSSGGLTRGRGMDDRQTMIWTLSHPVCAEYNNAMQEFTDVGYTTSDQHKDMSESRVKRDTLDSQKIEAYLTEKSPFTHRNELYSLDTGVTAAPSVNADNAKQLGEDILKSMVGQNAAQFVFKRSNKVITMGKKVTVNTDKVAFEVDPQLLFQRLVTAGLNSGELEHVFGYELCTYPTSLFDHVNIMSQAQKSVLASSLKKYVSVEQTHQSHLEDVCHVIDGGALIHRVPWKTGSTWSDIGDRYVSYVMQRYSQSTVVFDSYVNGPTTKDAVHARRSKGMTGPDVQFTPDMMCTIDKDVFLRNNLNKERLIHLLSCKLRQAGCEVLQASDDADVLLVRTAIQKACDKDVILVGDDTDLLVLLCSLASGTAHAVHFRPEPKTNQKHPPVSWDIKVTQNALGPIACRNILFLHAITGCDTTSKLFGIGKASALTKLLKDASLNEQAEVFRSDGVNKKDVVEAGERAIANLFGGNPDESLDKLRCQLFYRKVASSTSAVQPRTLPPSSAAAQYHSLRVYHQVQQWLGVYLDPQEWGWMLVDNKYIPIMTDLKPAPHYLLESIFCGCKTDCNSRRCSCRKYGLECSLACNSCKGLHCMNVNLPQSTNDV